LTSEEIILFLLPWAVQRAALSIPEAVAKSTQSLVVALPLPK
jgi:hypothetical protein